jgi:undecaprenyl-phosphate galactose phosphotransferase
MTVQHLSTDVLNQSTFLQYASAESYHWRRMQAAALDHSALERGRAAAPAAPSARMTKRAVDVITALLLLLVLSPLFLVIAIAAWHDKGPVFYGHRRIGRRGQPFKCWKFRSMVPNAGEVLARLLANDPAARAEWDANFKLRNDPRITPIGRFLRVTSLDELPQLINVVAGDMSLVGPRPIVTEEVRRYGAAYHDYARCRPGITGLWQISGRNDVGYRERVQLDQHYARHWSLRRDLTILLRTPFAVMRRSGAY